jgi:ABC-type spermidine/putrescine transport system permease subunit II
VIGRGCGSSTRALEEAALNLGASRLRVLAHDHAAVPRPAMIAAGVVAFLVSFENFNTTLMLVGSDAPLTITMYDRMAKVGSTPVLNAVSVFLMHRLRRCWRWLIRARSARAEDGRRRELRPSCKT